MMDDEVGEVEEVEEVVAESAKAHAPPKSLAPQNTTNSGLRPSSRRTFIILSFCLGILLVGLVGYWFLHSGMGVEPSSRLAKSQRGDVAENLTIPHAPPDQEPSLSVAPDTNATAPIEKTLLFATYRDSLNSITDTLQGVFASYSCEPTCFAWFDVKNQEGKELRPFYCPFSTVSGYPLNRLPKDGSTWSLITRESAIEMEAGEAKRGWPVVYELIELRRILNVARALEKPSPSGVYQVYEVDEAPVFRASDPHAWAYLETRMYPEAEKNLGIAGMVMVSFIVGHDGRVRQVEIQESSPYLRFNDEALRLVKAMPQWTAPGRKNGKSVNVRMTVRVDFDPK